jgi:sugar lactone lactonase YvrE
MRPFEILLLLSCLPALLAPFWRLRVPLGWRLVAALAPLAALGAQLAIEGPRSELLPGYTMGGIALLVGVLSLLSWRPALERPVRRWRTRLGRAASGVGLLVLVLSAVLAALMNAARIQPLVTLPPVAALPAPGVRQPGWQLGSDRSTATPRLTVVAEHLYLQQPRDLAFNPRVPGELWVVNGASDSVAIIHDADGGATQIEERRDGQASHFLHRPSAIAFGGDATTIDEPGTFATAQESTNDAVPYTGDDFMGPTLFSSDLGVFGRQPPFGRAGSHLDMLHESPLAMGIAWERDNVYWVVGGKSGAVTRYDFRADHGVGNHDHSDGLITHYAAGQLRRVPGVPSHLAYHPASGRLFIADTGNGRVVTLDTRTGSLAGPGPAVEPGVSSSIFADAALSTFVCAPGAGQSRQVAAGLGIVVSPGVPLVQPSGLEIDADTIFVGDYATGMIYAFDLQGRQISALDTGLGPDTLMGIALGPDGRLYLVDSARDRVLRVDA